MGMPQVMEQWHRLIGNGDPSGLDALLAESVVFHSPVVHSPQEGKALTTLYLTAAFHILANDSFRYVRELYGERDAALEFTTEIDGIQINGIDLIRWNEDGQIVDFKVMVRPMKAIDKLKTLMMGMLEQLKAQTS